MVKIGDVAVKLAGRDAGQICTVVELLNNDYVTIEGNLRRRKCNLYHLEFLGKNISVKKLADKNEVMDSLRKMGLEFKEIKKGSKKEKKIQEKKKLTKIKEIKNE